jgi:5-methyltetrahydrofolate--homocysteine methyltransferase
MCILDELKLNKMLLFDGALGTMLHSKGLQAGECPELWNITHRSDVREIAEAYLKAGSDIISTNSFGASRIKLARYGLGEKCVELNLNAAAICREAAGNDRHVAGSIGPTGKILLMGDITETELFDAFSEQAAALEKGGADIIIIETMTAGDEASLAVRAARANTGCTVIITMTFSGDNHGGYHTMMGVSPEEMAVTMKEAGAHIIGSNCGNGIREMIGIAKAIRAIDAKVPVIIQPNAGLPELIEDRTVFRESAEMMAASVPDLIKAGVNIIGGCCGTTPAHIKEMGKAIGR